MYWEAGLKFLMISVYSYLRHFFKHTLPPGQPRIRESGFEVK